jgi:glycosyltransferase involved in cell wall biosynthesis
MISFVVPAHDEERLLGRTLDSIHAAARAIGRPYELIVVDDASTDGTSAVAAAAGARVVRVDFRQIARTRNAGAREASGGILIFVDADTLVTQAVVQASLDALERGAAGGGATVSFDGRLPLWARLVIPVLGAVMTSARLAAGCYMFSSRDAFEKVAGFDETLFAAEEIYFSRALATCGQVVILRERVTTSGRKLRSHSGWETLAVLGGLLRHGTSMVRNREHLSMWYGERRNDG